MALKNAEFVTNSEQKYTVRGRRVYSEPPCKILTQINRSKAKFEGVSRTNIRNPIDHLRSNISKSQHKVDPISSSSDDQRESVANCSILDGQSALCSYERPKPQKQPPQSHVQVGNRFILLPHPRISHPYTMVNMENLP